ncbi:MAG TPA: hypothetical protein VMU50_07895 [Polyangia bacterium]|nr:hypothetical protein [Polyangia bacterium]
MRRPADQPVLDRLRRTRAAATLSALVLLAVMGAQLQSAWHEMTVRHVICADHGEMTDVPVGRAGIEAREEANALPSPSGSAGAQDSSPADDHEHCALALIIRGGTAAPARTAIVRDLPPPTVPAPRAPVSVIRPGRTVVLASAPKTSPPAI